MQSDLSCLFFFIWQYWSVWVLVRNLKSNRVDPSISNYKQGLYIVGECSTFSRYRTILLKNALSTLINFYLSYIFYHRSYKLYHEKIYKVQLRYRYVVTATLPNRKPTKFNGKQSWVCSLSTFPIKTTLSLLSNLPKINYFRALNKVSS